MTTGLLTGTALWLLAPLSPLPIIATVKAQGSYAHAQDLVIEAGSTTYRIKKLDLSGTTLQSADLLAVFDPKSPLPLQERLQKLSAGAITAPEIIAETTRDGLVQTIVYHNVTLGTVQAGQAASARVNNTTLKLISPDGTIEGTYGVIKATAVNLLLASQLAGAPGEVTTKDKSTAKIPFLGSLEINDVHLTNEKAHSQLDIQSLAARDIKGQALPTAPQTGQTDKTEDQATAYSTFDSLGGVLPGNFDIGQLDAEKLSLTLTNSQNQPLHLSFAKGSFSDYTAFTFGVIHLDDLALQSPILSFTLQNLGLRGVDFTTVRTLLREASQNNTVIGLQAILPRVDLLELAKLDVTQFGEKVAPTAEDPAGRDPLSFQVDALRMERSQLFQGTPTKINASINQFRVDLDKNRSGLFKDLAAFGYHGLDLSSRLAMGWSPEKQELVVDNLIDAKDMGTVTLAALLTNVSKEFFSAKDVEATRIATETARLKTAELTIDNDGIFDKFLTLQAQAQKKPLADLRRSYTSAAAVVVPILLGNGPGAKAIGAAVSKFIAEPKKLHLQATMPDGLTLKDVDLIQTPGLLLDKIEIQVSNEAKTGAPQPH
ncbi:hypothetical protein [Beijerinckia indica]|nr:hypothetical protein [Beijerinckia indica]